MSATSRTFYAPLFFPLANVFSAYKLPWDEVVETQRKILGSLNITGYLTLVATAVRSAIIAYIAMYWVNDYPAFGSGKNLEFGLKLAGRTILSNDFILRLDYENCLQRFVVYLGFLRFLGLVPLFFTHEGQVAQVQNNSKISFNQSVLSRRKIHHTCFPHRCWYRSVSL